MPKYKTIGEVQESDLPHHIEFPKEYFPVGIGPGSCDPKMMYMHALALNGTALSAAMGYEEKPWVILWLLDHVDWEKVNVDGE